MAYITILLLAMGGILAAAALIVSKQPRARELINNLMPFQGIIGVTLLGWGLVYGVRNIDIVTKGFKVWPLGAAVVTIAILCSILLGFILGMPHIAKMLPGDSPAEQKAMEMQAKLSGYSVVIGLAGIGTAALLLLIQLGIINRTTQIPGG